MDTSHISIVFQPCDRGIRFVASLKQLARQLLNIWYPSCNSIAHISICKIEVTEAQLERIIDLLAAKMRYEHAQHIYFNAYASYPSSGTFFLDPTVQSKAFLLQKMRSIVAETQRVIAVKKSSAPHLTISRGLDANNLNELRENDKFKHLDFDFFCKSIVLRRFDAATQQYVPFLEIPFGNETKEVVESGQLSFAF